MKKGTLNVLMFLPQIVSRDAKFENFLKVFMVRHDYFTHFEQSRTLCGTNSGCH